MCPRAIRSLFGLESLESRLEVARARLALSLLRSKDRSVDLAEVRRARVRGRNVRSRRGACAGETRSEGVPAQVFFPPGAWGVVFGGKV